LSNRDLHAPRALLRQANPIRGGCTDGDGVGLAVGEIDSDSTEDDAEEEDWAFTVCESANNKSNACTGMILRNDILPAVRTARSFSIFRVRMVDNKYII